VADESAAWGVEQTVQLPIGGKLRVVEVRGEARVELTPERQLQVAVKTPERLRSVRREASSQP